MTLAESDPNNPLHGAPSGSDESRRSQEGAIRQGEWLRSVVQNASDIIAILEPDGNIRYVSLAVERILGYKPEELVGTKALGYVHPEDLGFASVSLAETLENPGGLPPIEFRVRAADRSWHYVEMVLNNRFDDPNVRGVIVNTRDVTERVLAEEKLRESEEKFKAQYKSMPIPTYSWRGLDGDFVLVEYNDAAYEITKGHIADLLGVRATELYPDKPDVLEMFSRCFEERLTPLPWIS